MPKTSSSDHATSPAATVRAQLKETRAEIASAKKAAKDTLSEVMASQQEQVANARHEGYVRGVTDAKTIFEKNSEAVKKETVNAEQKIAKEFLATFGKKSSVAAKPKKKATTKKSASSY